MSRIGKKPVPVPQSAKVQLADGQVRIEGAKGKLTCPVPAGVSVHWDQAGRILRVERSGDSKRHKALHGLTRALLANAVHGVVEGYARSLEIQGVGYNARVQGNKLLLTLGFANVVEQEIPSGLTVETPAPTRIVVSGADKQAVGHFAAVVRKVRPPEPYKGKGVRYEGEVVRRKAGKAFAGGATS